MIRLASITVIAVLAVTSSYLLDDFPVLDKLTCKTCERVYVPVCGTNNKTFINSCQVKCYNDEIRKSKIVNKTAYYVKILFYGTCIENIVDNF